VFVTNWNHQAIGDAFWKGVEYVLTNGTFKCAERGVENFLAQGKVCN
jgi:hypothetical protein